jgi:hypothetical protein
LNDIDGITTRDAAKTYVDNLKIPFTSMDVKNAIINLVTIIGKYLSSKGYWWSNNYLVTWNMPEIDDLIKGWLYNDRLNFNDFQNFAQGELENLTNTA